MTVSIIVPVYNVARWLDECVGSVRAQSFADWQLILVDDGSTDASPTLCDNYAAADSRIVALHQPNAGASAARNVGLDRAQGAYIMFLDSDDYWCDTDVLARLVQEAETHRADIVRGEYKAVDSLGNDLFSRPVPRESLPYVGRMLTSGEYAKYAVHDENFMVLSLYRRECFADLRFEEGRVFVEDLELNARLFMRPWRCLYVPDIRFYAYRKLSTSVSNQGNPKALEGSFSMCDKYAALSEQCTDALLRRHYRYCSVMMYVWTLRTLAENPYYDDRKQYIKTLQLSQLQLRTLKRALRWHVFNKLTFLAFLPVNFAVRMSRIQHNVALSRKKAHGNKEHSAHEKQDLSLSPCNIPQ